MTTRLTFPSGGERCAAWLTLPKAAGPHPVVLLIHGGGATHAMMLDQYERRGAAARRSGLRRARLRFPPSR